ncbi:MAG: hypothetical protein KBT36_08970 [Kurthia sp.]|nr:hypothetical protein [Candidatus Kurthia equi]
MADVSKLNVAGATYNIKDAQARSEVSSFDSRISSCEQAIADTSASYDSNTETITFTYGII